MSEVRQARGEADWSCYDRAAVQSKFVTRQRDGLAVASMLIGGVRCSACVCLLEEKIGGLTGVRAIRVDALTTRAEIVWDPDVIPLSKLFAAISELGYTPQPYAADLVERALDLEQRQSLYRLIIAGLGMMQVLSFAVALYAGALDAMDPEIQRFLRLVSLVVASPVVLYSGMPFFTGALRGILARRPGMDVPVALAIGAAFTASVWNTFRGSGEVYFDSATMFVFFLSVARFWELTGRRRALSLTGALARQMPATVTRIVDGGIEAIGIDELAAGDLLMVRPGAVFPADGIVERDEIRVDESLLTGESRAVVRRPGDRVAGGSLNLMHAARVRVENVGADTVIAEIGRLIVGARDDKPRSVQIADRLAGWFVVAVLFIAAVVGICWWLIDATRAFEIVLAVLVVSCPCALALATPAVYTVATSALARLGLLIRNARVLDELHKVTDIVLDKTGTITRHAFGIGQVRVFGQLPEDRCIEIAAALESQSEHPIALAFRAQRSAADAQNVRAETGRGLEGSVAGREYRIGTLEFVAEFAASGTAGIGPGDTEQTIVFLADRDRVLARFAIEEQLRPGTEQALREFERRGKTITIASGDRAAPVRVVAQRLGIDRWSAALSPASKLQMVRGMQQAGHRVAMIGDGINDAPVLAGADVSIALASGTSLAQVSADCVIINENLGTLCSALDVVAESRRIVRQNLGWAVGYNLLAMPLAATGLLVPWMAALGMSASSLLVTMNALRLSRRIPQSASPPMGALDQIVSARARG
jgi:Cu2+-exporting ATPase